MEIDLPLLAQALMPVLTETGTADVFSFLVIITKKCK
jgi:hypothetical protein